MAAGRIVIRGGGDLATGIAQAFFRAGFPLLILESQHRLGLSNLLGKTVKCETLS